MIDTVLLLSLIIILRSEKLSRKPMFSLCHAKVMSTVPSQWLRNQKIPQTVSQKYSPMCTKICSSFKFKLLFYSLLTRFYCMLLTVKYDSRGKHYNQDDFQEKHWPCCVTCLLFTTPKQTTTIESINYYVMDFKNMAKR